MAFCMAPGQMCRREIWKIWWTLIWPAPSKKKKLYIYINQPGFVLGVNITPK
jgi:hypothetical protein